MKQPIIVNAKGDIYLYNSLEEAERDIEPPDVRNGLYTIYDSSGLVLQPLIVDDSRYDVIKICQTDVDRPAELKQLLIDFLTEIDNEQDFSRMTLPDLVAALEMRHGGK